MAKDDDSTSTFSYDGGENPDTFSLLELRAAVNSHFGTICNLKKLGEGGFHKVYDIVQDDGTSLGVVRVAAPGFPKDKLESEVATLKFLSAQTNVPVPKVYAWNSDVSNAVGAEYMIMQKLPGFSASEQWETLPMSVKEQVVSQIADHLMAIFALRFDRAGSLYLSSSSDSGIFVGPIVSTPFYHALDGFVRLSDAAAYASHLAEVSCFRGPFSKTSDYLRSPLLAEIHFLSQHRSIVLAEFNEENEEIAITLLEQAERTFRRTIELCSIYPGDIPIHGESSAPSKLFSIRLDDFRLSNIMIDDSGRVTGVIDLEAATISPLWECALLPRWLQDYEDPEASHEGGPAEIRQTLRALFLEKVGDGEWRTMYERGKPFRLLCNKLHYHIRVWEYMESWVDKRLAWAKDHPGIGYVKGEDEDEVNF